MRLKLEEWLRKHAEELRQKREAQKEKQAKNVPKHKSVKAKDIVQK